jgi:phenylpyruvate tautomerase PptA (4-oxalocrotonate tautomerase family)
MPFAQVYLLEGRTDEQKTAVTVNQLVGGFFAEGAA